MGKKKKKDKFGIKVPFQLAGTTIAFGQVGKAVGSAPLQQAGTTTAAFIGPAISIGMGGHLIRQLKGLKGGKKKNAKT